MTNNDTTHELDASDTLALALRTLADMIDTGTISESGIDDLISIIDDRNPSYFAMADAFADLCHRIIDL